jgi:hypothetical protein
MSTRDTTEMNVHEKPNTRKTVNYPEKSLLLAEFFGIMLGDGCISWYQIKITLHRFNDAQYIRFINNLIYVLFNVKPAIYTYPNDSIKKSVVDIVVSSRSIVEYLIAHGLVIGNKVRQQVIVPEWILENPDYKLACLRGLVDTDGCVYTNTYRVNSKEYSYKKIAFSNRSIPLLLFAYEILKDMELSPVMTNGIDVRITGQKKVTQYMQIVGTNNEKHLKRFLI